MKILVVEDDEVLAGILLESLKASRYIVEMAEDGEIGWECAQSANYDLILVDVGLPRLNGIQLCQTLRSQGNTTPILLMTAKDAKDERIRGLDAGADDYLIKPLDLDELHARVRALLRRGEVQATPILEVGNLRLNPVSCQVTYGEKRLPLTPKEYSVLELLMRNPLRVFSRGQMVEHLWTFDDPPQEESVKAHIKGLRQKFKSVGAKDWIENVYGLGYRLNPKLETESEQVAIQGVSETVSSASVEQEFSQAMDSLWEKYEGLMRERLTVLQSTKEAIATHTFSSELRQSATQAAHKLAGVLAMFGRETGTELAREIEQLLGEEKLFNSTRESEVISLIEQLNECLNLTENPGLDLPQSPLKRGESIYSDHAIHNEQSLVNVLVVDDDPVFLAVLRPMLEPWGIRMTGLETPLGVLEKLPSLAPDLLILDVEMPQMSGIELCQSIRQDSQWQALPILFLTAHSDRETIEQVFRVGADDYVVKPVVGEELLTRITNRLERTRLLQTLSTKDPLTGLANQPKSNRDLELLIEQKKPFCFVLLSVSSLGQINQQYGHFVGNQVLQRWGSLLQSSFKNEVVGYWGNGEFIIGLVGLTITQGRDRILDSLTALRKQVFQGMDGNRFQVSFQGAIATYPQDGLTVQLLYQQTASCLETI